MKIVKFLEDAGLLIKGAGEAVKKSKRIKRRVPRYVICYNRCKFNRKYVSWLSRVRSNKSQ